MKGNFELAKNNNVTTLVFRGRLKYAKVLGDPVLNYNKDGQEWKFDFIPNDPKGANKDLKVLGVDDRLRSLTNAEGEPRYDGEEYMSFKQKATRNDGTPNYPIRVEDISGNDWPEDKLIGNDTVADVKFVVLENGSGRFNGVYPRSIRILDLVSYQTSEFAPVDENDEYFKKAKQVANDVALLAGTNPKTSVNDSSDTLDDELPDDLTA